MNSFLLKLVAALSSIMIVLALVWGILWLMIHIRALFL